MLAFANGVEGSLAAEHKRDCVEGLERAMSSPSWYLPTSSEAVQNPRRQIPRMEHANTSLPICH
jgi:hypothetical protein